MGEFFKLWRRKFGVVTLVTACVFMGGWVRSYTTTDILRVCTGKKRVDEFNSDFSRLAWVRWENYQSIPAFYSSEEANELDLFHCYGIPCQSHWCEFKYGSEKYEHGSFTRVMWMIPYWSVIVPLTLISFWLLLSKPNASTQKRITEPISDEEHES